MILGPCDMRHVAKRLGLPPARCAALPNGGGTNVTNLALTMIRRGIPFELGTLSSSAQVDVEQIEVDRVTLWIARGRDRRRLRDAYRVERRNIRQIIEQSECTVVAAHWTYVYGLAAVLQTRKPYVVFVHDCPGEVLRLDRWRYLPHYLIAAFVIRKARRLACVSRHVQKHLWRCWGKHAEVVPNLLQEVLPERTREQEADTIVCVGSDAVHKNVKRVVTSFNRTELEMKVVVCHDIPFSLAHGGHRNWSRS